MFPDFQRFLDRSDSYTSLSKDMKIRLISGVAEYIPYGSEVTVEGPPIYLSRPWSLEHEFGYNQVLPFLMTELSCRDYQLSHAVLIDDYSETGRYEVDEYLNRMRLPKTVYALESSFVDDARVELARLKNEGRTIFIAGAIYLSWNCRNDAILQTKSGRMGCALLDALFQRSKGPGWHIILHPRQFRSQQEQMKIVLQTFKDVPSDFHLLNIFTRGNNLSQIIHTNRDGKTRQI